MKSIGALAVLSICLVSRVSYPQTTRELTPAEKQYFSQRHLELANRLSAHGYWGPTPNANLFAFAYLPLLGRTRIERVEIDDGRLTSVFARNSKGLIGLLNRAAVRRAGAEREKNTRYPISLTLSKAKELAHSYLSAIEGTKSRASDLGCYDEGGISDVRGGENRQIDADAKFCFFEPRFYKGFAFREDRKELAISAVDGSLVSYGVYYTSSEPPSITSSVSKDDALKKAKDITSTELRRKGTFDPNEKIDVNDGEGKLFTTKKAYEEALAKKREWRKADSEQYAAFNGVEPLLTEPPKLMIVNPNSCYTDKYRGFSEVMENWNPKTRLAWVVKLLYKPGLDKEQERHLDMEIWIDAADGKVLGGELPY